ncbi:hypothetical protein GCM10022225_14950 [Plantactinospora mayteni]|uniref:Uncharacterized protein n=1 Tax=Plantactinospora mayteni TaxID=566021 RepID=A0ABQ4EFS5_9ACTN|nr:hypothetical protein Pma05_01430 [Plantactinospora mayteni]
MQGHDQAATVADRAGGRGVPAPAVLETFGPLTPHRLAASPPHRRTASPPRRLAGLDSVSCRPSNRDVLSV